MKLIFVKFLLIFVGISLATSSCATGQFASTQPTMDNSALETRVALEKDLANAQSTQAAASSMMTQAVEETASTPPTITPIVNQQPTDVPIPSVPLNSGSVMFEDNFNDGDIQGWLPAKGTWSVVDGQLLCVSSNEGVSVAYIGEGNWTNYTVSTRVRSITESVDMGVLAHLQDADNYYVGLIWRGEAQIKRGTTHLIVTPYSVASGTWYTIRLEVIGTQIKMYVDDVLVAATEDGVFLMGKIGLRCASSSQIYFDDVVVKPLN